MSLSSRYCKRCLGILRDNIHATATRSSTTANRARHFSSPAQITRNAALLARHESKHSLSKRNESHGRFVNNVYAPSQGAGFSTSARRRRAIINPRKDDDGNEMDIEITARASNRLRAIMDKDSNPDLALRITVESGGCHGFQYLMSLTDISKIDKDEDTVFEGDKGTKVVMDEPSLDLLKGSKVDYTMELIGSQFKIVDNPLATSSCGCGTSFDIKAA